MSHLEHSSALTLANIDRHHIGLLSEQLDRLYPSLKEERLAISQWEEDQEFSILGVIELFSTEIQGYAEQLKADHFTASVARSVNHLRQLDPDKIGYFADWYFQDLGRYPQTRQYIEQLDYLRLLVLESFDRLLTHPAP